MASLKFNCGTGADDLFAQAGFAANKLIDSKKRNKAIFTADAYKVDFVSMILS